MTDFLWRASVVFMLYAIGNVLLDVNPGAKHATFARVLLLLCFAVGFWAAFN